MKRAHLFLLIILLIFTSACNSTIKKPEPTNTVKIRPTYTPKATEIPTPIKTQEPVLHTTIKPGEHTYAEGIKSDAPLDLYYFDNTKENGVQVLTESIAIQFFPVTELKTVYISCPSMNDSKGTLQFEVFAWLGTYDSTIMGQAILNESFTDYADNALLKLEFETPVPDGEYLILITSPAPEEGVGIWTKLSSFEGQRVYADGIPLEDISAQMQIKYANTPNNKYGTISD